MDTANTVWGIDLGTTYSCIARVDEHGYPVVVNNLDGDPITPSVVLFESEGEAVVGQAAKGQAALEPHLICSLVKQNMGDSSWAFEAHGKKWTAPEVSSLILKEIAGAAAQITGDPVEKVVITVPAYFGVAEREATIAAGKMAGLDVKNILNEPTAAAFSYGFAQSGEDDETVLVYDLGGGTFDVTVIRLEGNESGGTSIRVVATGGDHHLGGSLWDQRLVTLVANKFMQEAPGAADPLDDPAAEAELQGRAEAIKRALTSRDSQPEAVISGTDRAKVTVTREEFEAATQDLLEQTIQFTQKTVDVAKEKGVDTIDRVLLVGGSSFMPAVARRLTEAFPGWNPELQDPNQAVAKGAALAGFQQALVEAIRDDDDETEASSNGASASPPSPERVQEVAEQFGVRANLVEKVLATEFTNVCSRGFGVKVVRDGVANPGQAQEPHDFRVDHIILPNTALPLTGTEHGREQEYYTVYDGQDAVNLEIWEQNSQDPAEDLASNKFLERGLFQMTRAYPQGSAIRVALGMENSGVLRLQATDPDGRQMDFTATASDAVMSEEQLKESTAKVQAIRVGS